MSILSRWFRRLTGKKRRRIQREYLEVVDDSVYGTVDSFEDPLSIKNHVVNICEQMIDISRELDDVRQEYDQVTAYLNDIQVVEGLEGEQRRQLEEVATHMTKLVNARNDYLNAEQKISDDVFSQMEEMEDEIPSVIRRLKVNEADLETVKHDLNYLASEKVEWCVLKQEREEEIEQLRKISFGILFGFGGLAILVALLSIMFEWDMLPLFIVALLAVFLVGFFVTRGIWIGCYKRKLRREED